MSEPLTFAGQLMYWTLVLCFVVSLVAVTALLVRWAVA